ncbi:NfeD family protein [Oceanobacillus sp. FSL H7-0719]|uniref:NfeD family protein n=1 Tax=Oceanobacillus sp. FSL H7-0719 TaxID=2954507 RepID=UPI003253E7C6
MAIFDYEWIGFVITFLGTLFLIGEVLVNMRGLFALLGIGFITVYFGAYVGTESVILMIIIYFVGLVLIVIDGKIVNDGTLATIGLVSMLTAVGIAAPSVAAAVYAIIGVLLGVGCSFFFLKVFKRREMWTKIALKDQLSKEAGYNSMNMEYETLVNEVGVTLNDLRPVGTIKINGKDYSAISDGKWIKKDSKVRVVKVDGTKILVEETL